MTWDRQLYFPSEGRRAEDFFSLKNPKASAGFEPANLGTKGQHATPRPPKPRNNNTSTLKRPTVGKFTIFSENHILCEKRAELFDSEVLVALFVTTRVFWNMKPCEVLCGGSPVAGGRLNTQTLPRTLIRHFKYENN